MKKEQSTLVEQVVKIICQNKSNQMMLSYGNKNYDILHYKVENYQPDQILTMYKVISLKNYRNPDMYNEEFWFQNELKVYIWTLVAYSYQRQLLIQNFTSHDWSLFTQAFNNRPADFFQFQANFILKPNKLYKAWTQQEEQLLKQIIMQIYSYLRKDQISNKWNFVARQLFKLSDTKFYKTPKQCRERWLNHLDPKKKRSAWSIEQDVELIKGVKQIGKKWAQISKLLGNTRTEHMIKNRFKAIVYSYSKRCPKIKQQQVVEKFLTSHLNDKKFFIQEKSEKSFKRKQKIIKKDPSFVCRVSPRNRSTANVTSDDILAKISTEKKLPINIEMEPVSIEQSSSNKQTKAAVQQRGFVDMMDEQNERAAVMQFFQEMDSKMSNIPFEMENDDIESFISKCMLGSGSDYFADSRLMCPDLLEREAP